MKMSNRAISNELVIFSTDVSTKSRLQNFYAPEPEFAWSTGKWCEIIFSVPPELLDQPNLELSIDLDVFKAPPDLIGQDVFIYLNGLRLASRHITGRTAIVFQTPDDGLIENDNVLTFDTPDSATPKKYGLKDDRILGLQLFSISGRFLID